MSRDRDSRGVTNAERDRDRDRGALKTHTGHGRGACMHGVLAPVAPKNSTLEVQVQEVGTPDMRPLPLTDLGADLLLSIFSFTDAASLRALQCTSHNTRIAAGELFFDSAWQAQALSLRVLLHQPEGTAAAVAVRCAALRAAAAIQHAARDGKLSHWQKPSVFSGGDVSIYEMDEMGTALERIREHLENLRREEDVYLGHRLSTDEGGLPLGAATWDEEMIHLCRKLLAAEASVHGEEHKVTTRRRRLLAQMIAREIRRVELWEIELPSSIKDMARAEVRSLLARVMEWMDTHHGPQAECTLRARSNFLTFHDGHSKVTLLREQLEIARDSGASPAAVASMCVSLALHLVGEEPDAAESLYREALQIKRSLYGDANPGTVRTALHLVECLEHQGKDAEAAQLESEVVEWVNSTALEAQVD